MEYIVLSISQLYLMLISLLIYPEKKRSLTAFNISISNYILPFKGSLFFMAKKQIR